jgi:hypothetical protein
MTLYDKAMPNAQALLLLLLIQVANNPNTLILRFRGG